MTNILTNDVQTYVRELISKVCEPLKIQIFTVSDAERIEAVNPVRKNQK